jgi:subtilisin family serine protease
MKTKLIVAVALISGLTAIAQAQTVQSWMHADVGAAWKQGFRGQGTTITVVDDFNSNYTIRGKLTNVAQVGRHGQWTAFESSLIAPAAAIRAQDYTAGRAITLGRGLNVINLSYGMMAAKGYANVGWSAQETSIINHAKTGAAIVSKAAGNDSGIAVGAPTRQGQMDYLNRDLIGAKTAIFVGALNSNGTTTTPATMASYSNVAGTNPAVQKQFLVVGVEASKTGLAGTSFAAPVITGYAAILGSKFATATPTQITNQLLNTARKDTIRGYNVAVHGRGEASLSRALAPVSIR